jgi:hypothetical protein
MNEPREIVKPVKRLIVRIAKLSPDEQAALRQMFVVEQESCLTRQLVTGLRPAVKPEGGIGAFFVTGEMTPCLKLFKKLGSDEQGQVVAAIPLNHTVRDRVQYELKRQEAAFEERQRHEVKLKELKKPLTDQERRIFQAIYKNPDARGEKYCNFLDAASVHPRREWRERGCKPTYPKAYSDPREDFYWRQQIYEEKKKLFRKSNLRQLAS